METKKKTNTVSVEKEASIDEDSAENVKMFSVWFLSIFCIYC
jgi:hypothetical protein